MPQDDLLDVSEASDKIEACIEEVFNENEHSIAFSGLLSATTYTIIAKSKNAKEADYYLRAFNSIFYDTLKDFLEKNNGSFN